MRPSLVADWPEPPLAHNAQLLAFLRRRAKIENLLCCYDFADDEVRQRCATHASALKQVLLGNLPPPIKA